MTYIFFQFPVLVFFINLKIRRIFFTPKFLIESASSFCRAFRLSIRNLHSPMSTATVDGGSDMSDVGGVEDMFVESWVSVAKNNSNPPLLVKKTGT